MFLDDQLYDHTINKKVTSPDDFKDLINELYKLCEDRWKPQLAQSMKTKDAKILLDRIFISWDLFVKRLYKENWYLVDFIDKYSYKNTYFSNPKLKEIYDNL